MICFRPRFSPIDATVVEDSNVSTDSPVGTPSLQRDAGGGAVLSCSSGAAMLHCRGFLRPPAFVRSRSFVRPLIMSAAAAQRPS